MLFKALNDVSLAAYVALESQAPQAQTAPARCDWVTPLKPTANELLGNAKGLFFWGAGVAIIFLIIAYAVSSDKNRANHSRRMIILIVVAIAIGFAPAVIATLVESSC